MQSWPLQRKIQVSQTRIIEWYQEFDGKVYVSFSGGKDSTVLLDLVRRVYPDVPAVFCDTGLEHPEIREFVKTKEHVERLYPSMWNKHTRKYERCTFVDVIRKYGYPVISKEQSAFIEEYRNTRSAKLRNMRINGNKYGRGKISKKYQDLINAPFLISDKCCDVMKKHPAKLYEKETGNHPIVGTMACESDQRKSNWMMYGCNAFSKTRPTSQPLSFWTEQDILTYIKEFNIPYAKDVYGDIIEKDGKLVTTKASRTGCMFCMFGVHLEKEPNRFQRMKVDHPKQYEFCIKDVEDGGLGLGKVLDYIGVKY